MSAQPDYDKDEVDLPAPYASFSIAGSFLDRRQNPSSFRRPGILSKGSWKSRTGLRASFALASKDPTVQDSLDFRRPPDYWGAMHLPAPARPKTPPLPTAPVVVSNARPAMIMMNGNSAHLDHGGPPREAVGATVAGAGIMAAAAAGGFNRSAFILILCRLCVCAIAPCMLAFRRVMSQKFKFRCYLPLFRESVLLC